GGDEEGQVGPHLAQALDHGEQGQAFADADAVQPDEVTGGAGEGGDAEALVDTDGVLLALAGAGVEQAGGQRFEQARGQPVEEQGRAHAQTRSRPVILSASASTAVRRSVHSAATSDSAAPSG